MMNRSLDWMMRPRVLRQPTDLRERSLRETAYLEVYLTLIYQTTLN